MQVVMILYSTNVISRNSINKKPNGTILENSITYY